MRSNDTAFEDGGSHPRHLGAVAAGLGPFLAAALVLGALYGAPPMPARVEAATAVPAGGSGPGQARPPAPRLCFHGPGGELLDLAPAGRPCP